MSTSNVTALPRVLMPWEKDCIHDIIEICRAEGIPLVFGMAHFHVLKVMYGAASSRARLADSQ